MIDPQERGKTGTWIANGETFPPSAPFLRIKTMIRTKKTMKRLMMTS